MAIARGCLASRADQDEATARHRRPEAHQGHQTQRRPHGASPNDARRHSSRAVLASRRWCCAQLTSELASSARAISQTSTPAVCHPTVLSARDEAKLVGLARMHKRPEPDGLEPLTCSKIGKIAALLPYTQLPPVALADWSTKHDRRENELASERAPALLRRLGLGLGLGLDNPAAVNPVEVRKRPLSSLDTSAENLLDGSTENLLPERKRRYQGGQRPSPHPSGWW